MTLMPDPTTATIDRSSPRPPWSSSAYFEPSIGEPHNRDPRGIAKKAEAWSCWAGDTVFVGPEAEFFVFDDVRFGDAVQHRLRWTR